jgi:hypothetical protein
MYENSTLSILVAFQTDLQKLQNSINQMEERGMQNDPRYAQARQLQQSMVAR